MNIRCFATKELATVYVAACIEAVMTKSLEPVLGLATGSTPIPLYRQLVDFYRQGLSFRHVTTINLDEYVGLAASHPQSYHAFMGEHLFGAVDLVPERIHVPNGMAADLREECQRYDEIIARHPIDLQILGIGRNGHIGFNEPDVALQAHTHVVRLTEDTIEANARFFTYPDSVPTEAITMGIQSILQARTIVLMAFGRDKAGAVQRALSGEVSTDMPASFLQMHPHVTFVLDEEAASQIEVDGAQPSVGRGDDAIIPR